MTEGKGSYIKTECGRNILDLTCGSQSQLFLTVGTQIWRSRFFGEFGPLTPDASFLLQLA